MERIFEIATNISKPLMLAGFLAAAFFFIARQVLKAGFFPQLTRQHSGEIIKLIINRLFILALIAMILGFAGYVTATIYENNRSGKETGERYERPANGLITLKLEDLNAVDYAARPETKNVTLRFKVIPLSKEKYVPLKHKGTLVLIDSTGTETSYTFDANFEGDGIPPGEISYIYLDGLLPINIYQSILSRANYSARAIFYYDNDIVATTQTYSSDLIRLNASTIRDLSD